jgi:cytoskeletal protein RodZ
MAYLQAMEEDRFSHLPRGRMAEEMITKYAKYLNLDVAAALLQYRSFQYSEPVEPITDFGAANLVVIRYAGFIRAVLGLLVLGGLSYGLWVYENDRLRAMYASVTTYVGGRTPTASIPTLTNADAAAGAQTATASATATPTTAQATQTTIPSSTPEPTARVTSTTAASATAEPTATATNVPASATATTRATQTSKPSMTRTATRTSKPSATAQASATVRTTPSRTATATKKP